MCVCDVHVCVCLSHVCCVSRVGRLCVCFCVGACPCMLFVCACVCVCVCVFVRDHQVLQQRIQHHLERGPRSTYNGRGIKIEWRFMTR